MKPPYLVAEVSKNWRDGLDLEGRAPAADNILSGLFEKVINANHKRGYVLDDWKLDRQHLVIDGVHYLNETIIAVFRKGPPDGH